MLEGGLPKLVVDEFEAYLRCGIGRRMSDIAAHLVDEVLPKRSVEDPQIGAITFVQRGDSSLD